MQNAPQKFRRYSLFPKLMSQVLDPLTKPLFKSRGLAGTNFIADWSRIIGAELAGHCWPEKISFPMGKKTGGTLMVACENGFATEIQHMQPIILERLNIFYGYQAVTKFAISHSAPKKHTPSRPTATLPPNGRGKSIIVSDIDDPELKQALQSLANTLGEK